MNTHTYTTEDAKLYRLLPYWTADGWAKDKAVKNIVAGKLLPHAPGKGNAARRRLDRLDDEAEAKAFEQELWEMRSLTEEDVDALAERFHRSY